MAYIVRPRMSNGDTPENLERYRQRFDTEEEARTYARSLRREFAGRIDVCDVLIDGDDDFRARVGVYDSEDSWYTS